MQGELGAQYFARYAEPEAQLAAAVEGEYGACLVVPVRGEAPSLLTGYREALRHAPGRVLLVLVLNATDAEEESTHVANQRLLGELAAQFPARREFADRAPQAGASVARADNFDLLWLDRASAGRRLRAGEGVGNARKIGCDLAVALWARGQIRCPRIACSDADVTLPSDYFSSLVGAAASARDPVAAHRAAPAAAPSPACPSSRSAWLWPFRHEPGGDRAIDEATLLYEISLRYYVLGLAAARSGYAYQSIGSTLCVAAPSYFAVRGFPKRAAGEDFYLLDKLAKVAPIERMATWPLRIAARASDRVPFGTGRRSREIAERRAQGGEFLLFAPDAFRALSAVITGLNDFAHSGAVRSLGDALDERVPKLADAARTVLTRLGVFEALLAAGAQAPRGPVLRRRVHTFFDALRTLRFIHGLRDACLPSLPWRTALAEADFACDALDGNADAAAVSQSLADTEARLPAAVGPTIA